MNFKKKNDGQALIEVLVAVSVLTIGFLGVMTLLSRSLSLNRVVADSYTATYLAGEGVEVIKNMIDANIIQQRGWRDGLREGEFELAYDSTSLDSNQNRFLQFDPVTHHYDYAGNEATRFKRKVRIAFKGEDEIQINSIVAWSTRGGGTFQIDTEDHFFNWRKYLTP